MKYKGQLEGFPEHIVELMLKRQKEQAGRRNIKVFEKDITQSCNGNGFTWSETPEGHEYWEEVIRNRQFNYPFPKVSTPGKVDTH